MAEQNQSDIVHISHQLTEAAVICISSLAHVAIIRDPLKL